MTTREEIVESLLKIASIFGSKEVDIERHIEFAEYFFERRIRRGLINIEQKLDVILERRSVGECRFSDSDGGNIAQLLTGVGTNARADAVSHLSECLQGARQITICDPYFLKSSKSMPCNDYITAVESALPNTLKSIEIFVGVKKRDKNVADGLNIMFRNKGIKLSCIKTDDIHDRVWIRDYDHAYAVGTSFNSLGSKCAFILRLPDTDKRAFISELADRKNALPTSRAL